MSIVSKQLIDHAIDYPDEHLECMHFHHGMGCNEKMLIQFISGSQSLSKMYLIVHLVPFLLFKRKKTKEK
jgi:hypothetical protein